MRADHATSVAIYVLAAGSLLGGCTARKVQPVAPPALESSLPNAQALQSELDQRDKEIGDLKAEIDHLRGREDDLTRQLKEALRHSPGKTISDSPAEGEVPLNAETTIRTLQSELKRERQRRVQLEQQLERLKAETSSPPLPVAALPLPPPEPLPEAAIPPAEHVAEPPQPEPPVALEPPAAEVAPAPVTDEIVHPAPPLDSDAATEVAALRERGIKQETQHQEAMSSLARVLDADRRRQEDLEAEVVSLRSGAPGTEGAVSADSNEVNHLRTRLEAERRRNAELTAKLKLAGRVTDLVFRMQNQAGPPPAPYPRVQYSQQEPGPNAPSQPYIDPRGEVNQPIAPAVPEAQPPADVGEAEPGVPQIEQPPVFDNQGPDVVEEVTQD